ncbi:sensor domain-containing protein [Myxococcota bacterium]|nr:sensor domain-containing protein [Myxococcota bacterium]
MHPIDTYIQSLRDTMKGADPVLVQDAVFDATEHLTGALDELLKKSPQSDPIVLAREAIARYGSPEEIASAYGKSATPITAAPAPSRSLLGRFFGVIADKRAWGALLYLLISLGTGIFYFTWVVTGASLSLGLMVLVIGLPFLGVFLLSVRGIALFEGRLVEWLLGSRMPRHPIIDGTKKGWWEQFKGWISDRYTWSAMGFFVLMLPLGVIYFSLMVTFMSTSAALVAAPFVYSILHHEVIQIHHLGYVVEPWVYYLLPLVGIILFFSTLHLAKALGRLQAFTAKAMLVKG